MPNPNSLRTNNFFRRIALSGWNKSPYFTFSSRYPGLRRWLISQLSSRHKKVLSVGCGSGELEIAMSRLGRQVMGMDICFEMLQSARRRGLRNLVQADALNLPFAPSSFDLIVFPESIGYFDLHAALPGVARVVKKGGQVLITAYPTNFASDRIYNRRTARQLTDELQLAGFHIADQKLLTIKRGRVTESPSEARAELIYILASNTQ